MNVEQPTDFEIKRGRGRKKMEKGRKRDELSDTS
jgi:hypothetical protein